MPRRPLLRRTTGVLATAALLVAVAAATSIRGVVPDPVAHAAPPTPPALLRHMRAVLPKLFLSRAEARALDFEIHPNTFDNKYPPDAAATFRVPLPGQTPNSPMMSEFFAGGFVLGKAENLVGVDRPGNVAIVVWAFRGPEGAYRGLRALRDLSGLHAVASTFAPGAVVLSFPGTGVSDLIWVRGRALVRATAGDAQGGVSMTRARERVARVVDAKISSQPFVGGARLPAAPRPDLATLAGRLASLRIAENDLPGGLDTESWRLRGASTQVISVAQIHGNYVTYAWAFATPAAARAALRVAAGQAGVRSAPAHSIRSATRVVRPGTLLRDDLFWVRGSLLLQVGGYGPPGIPLLQSRQDLVARRLDARASALA